MESASRRLKESDIIKRLFHKLKRGRIYKFPKSGYMKSLTPEIPETHGVYIIYSPREKVLHVGRTLRGKRGLSQRLNNHLTGHSSFVAYYLDWNGAKLRRGYKFQFIAIEDHRHRALLEAFAIGALCPAYIGLGLPLDKPG